MHWKLLSSVRYMELESCVINRRAVLSGYEPGVKLSCKVFKGSIVMSFLITQTLDSCPIQETAITHSWQTVSADRLLCALFRWDEQRLCGSLLTWTVKSWDMGASRFWSVWWTCNMPFFMSCCQVSLGKYILSYNRLQFAGIDMSEWSQGSVSWRRHGAFYIVFSKQLGETQSGQSDTSLMSMFSQRKPHWRSQSPGLLLSTVTDLQMLSNPGSVNCCDRGKRWLMCLLTD